MTLRSLFTALFICIWAFAFTQAAQSEYLEAKRLMQIGQFQEAERAFAGLVADRTFGKYSSFYQAFCAYKGGNKKNAIVLWEQQLKRNPGPEIKPEVIFWLAYSSLESGLYSKGIEFANLLTDETYSSREAESILNQFLSPLSAEQLKSLFVDNPGNKAIASLLLAKEYAKPPGARDTQLIKDILSSELVTAVIPGNQNLPVLMKDTYQIAVLLPFMYDPSKPEMILQNQLVTGLYQGMEFGRQHLDSIGIKVNLVPYDTRRDELVTDLICKKLPDATDLIIGPLYPGPIRIAGEYSLSKQINMVNPVSSNSELLIDNPFSFLFKPTNETNANALAEYADTTFTNRNVMIFYENNQRDSTTAFTYKALMEMKGFNVVWFQEINKTNAKQILDTITAQYTVYYSKAEADSVQLLPGRFVKERRLRPDEINRIMDFQEGKRPQDSLFYLPMTIREEDQKEVTYYESKFYIKEDSIGHIFGASRSNALVNNLISAVETKGNNIGLLGYGDWIDFTMLSYNQLERIGVVMAHPDYTDPTSESYNRFTWKVRDTYFMEPSIYQMIGYELMLQLGMQLKQSGRYFQIGLREGAYFPGTLFQGIQYDIFNDNQVVPLVRFENARLKVINPK